MSLDTKTIHMKYADWQQWDIALRSDEYAQGTSTLHNTKNNTYCCLGVLQHCLTGEVELFAGKPKGYPTLDWLRDHGIKFGVGNRLSPNVIDPYLPSIDRSASTANDCGKYSFVAIADAIKECVQFTDKSDGVQ